MVLCQCDIVSTYCEYTSLFQILTMATMSPKKQLRTWLNLIKYPSACTTGVKQAKPSKHSRLVNKESLALAWPLVFMSCSIFKTNAQYSKNKQAWWVEIQHVLTLQSNHLPHVFTILATFQALGISC